ncbi:hypothetical protein MAM1_0360d10023 [Mucor ambiguus]|uniref:Uncharacterized protein n=1 Tax=Mucor ambiguus TaxID=91626 RepID=A0A0C9N365_9FUNG|nr:hypothetical protein MAM1_0360d10023 [Mucor ambiguus]
MMLRPSKIFVPFHQLRHYIEARISELMVIKQPPQMNHQPVIKRFVTTTAQQQQQQSIAFFSDLQRSLVQKAYLQQSPPLIKRNAANQKLLLKVIQHHFPVVKVFSAPSLHGRMWTTAASGNGQQQFRTMMSGSSTSGGTCTASSFMTWGFPRTTAATVGFGRSPAFARQFSTTKSPSCVTLFQNTTSTTSGQSNVFAHISSRIFSPAGTKMNQPDLNEKQPKYASFHPASSVSSCDSDEESPSSLSKSRLFALQTKGMGELVDQNDNNDEACLANANLVRRESVSSCRSRSSKQKLNKKHTGSTSINHDDLESIIRHDDLSSLYTTDNSMSNKSSTLSKRSSSSSSRPHYSRHHRLKHPPDQQYHVRRQDDHSLTTVKNGGITKKKSSSLSASISSTNTYLLITLDTLQFLDKRKEWSTQSLSTSFIDSIEMMAYDYQVHINYVLKLLDTLQKHGKFRVVARKSELRIYFPVPPKSKQEAIEFLRSFNIVDSMLNYFTIVVEDRQFMLSPSDYNDDYFSFAPSSAAATALNNTIHSNTTDGTIGPDYFKDLQMFLDRTDYLIETSPAFRSS